MIDRVDDIGPNRPDPYMLSILAHYAQNLSLLTVSFRVMTTVQLRADAQIL